MLAGRRRDRAELVQRPLRVVHTGRSRISAPASSDEVVGPQQGRAGDGVRREPLLEHAEPRSSRRARSARGRERRGPLHLLRDAMRVADDGELLVDAQHLARRCAAPGEHDDLEQQREGERLRMIERAGLGDRLADRRPAPVPGSPAASACAPTRSGRKCQARCRSARRAARETPDRRARAPRARCACAGFELAEVEQRRPERPLANHLQVGIAEPLEERRASRARCRSAIPISPDTMWCADSPISTGITRAGIARPGGTARAHARRRRRPRHRIALARLDRQAVGHLQRRARRPRARGCRLLLASSASPRCASRADLVVRIEPRGRLRGAVPVVRGAHAVSRRSRTAPRCPPAQSHGWSPQRCTSRSAIARLSAARRVARSDS